MRRLVVQVAESGDKGVKGLRGPCKIVEGDQAAAAVSL
jgi:hypothetical protein